MHYGAFSLNIEVFAIVTHKYLVSLPNPGPALPNNGVVIVGVNPIVHGAANPG